MTVPYPRSKLRSLIKRYTNRNLAKDADVLIYMDYCLFIEKLLSEASAVATRNNQRVLLPSHVDFAKEKTLRRFKA